MIKRPWATISSLFNFLKNQNLNKTKLNKFIYLADNYVGNDSQTRTF